MATDEKDNGGGEGIGVVGVSCCSGVVALQIDVAGQSSRGACGRDGFGSLGTSGQGGERVGLGDPGGEDEGGGGGEVVGVGDSRDGLEVVLVGLGEGAWGMMEYVVQGGEGGEPGGGEEGGSGMQGVGEVLRE